MLIQVIKSNRIGKRFVAIFSNGEKTHFGSSVGSTYIDNHDKTKRINYLKRHQVNEDWNDPYKPGTLSAFILWGKNTNILDNIKDFNKMFF